MNYRTRDKDMLDKICYDYYGQTSHRIVEMVLEANPSLADYGTIFPAGLSIKLPDLEPQQNFSSSVKLWD